MSVPREQAGPLSLVEINLDCVLIGWDQDVADASSLMPKRHNKRQEIVGDISFQSLLLHK